MKTEVNLWKWFFISSGSFVLYGCRWQEKKPTLLHENLVGKKNCYRKIAELYTLLENSSGKVVSIRIFEWRSLNLTFFVT